MFRFIFFLILIYLVYRIGRVLLRRYLERAISSRQGTFKKPNDKFKDAEDARFTDIKEPGNNKPKE